MNDIEKLNKGLNNILNDLYKETERESFPYLAENKDEVLKKLEEIILEYKEKDYKRYYVFERYYIDDIKVSDIAAELERSYSRVSEVRKSMLRKIRYRIHMYFTNTDNISNCGFSSLLYNILRRGGYTTIQTLSGIKYSDFVRIRNAGDKSWNELKEYLDKNNIRYSNDNKYFGLNKLKSDINNTLDLTDEIINRQWLHTTKNNKKYNIVIQYLGEK